MNGIGLLVLLAMSGQVGSERDFGWQIAPDGVLEYIVQVSPAAAAQMQSLNRENVSDIPPDLVGRASRVTFRIGTSTLPREPSLEKIRQMERYSSPNDVASLLGPGKLSDVETDSVVHAQQQSDIPPLPPNFDIRSNSPQAATGNIVDHAGELARQNSENGLLPNATSSNPRTNLANQFLQRAGANPQPGTASEIPSLPRMALPNTGAPHANTPAPSTSRFDSESSRQPATAMENSLNTSGLPGSSKWLNSNESTDAIRTADRSAAPHAAPRTRAGASYDASTPPILGTNQNRPHPGLNPNFGPARTPSADSGYVSRGQDRNGYGAPQGNAGIGYGGGTYANSGYPPNQMPAYDARNDAARQPPPSPYGGENYGHNYPPPAYDPGLSRNPNLQPRRSAADSQPPAARVASNQPATPIEGAPSATTPTTEKSNATPSPSDGQTGFTPSGESTRAKNSEVWLQIFFLVSLIVNFYLGMLIRKLLTRYRSLLSSVRGQTA